ncbi:MAG: TonB-dependent receptor [Cellvibrionaceae bacterium]|nr:TonB-dependent receptor [Cellvibrionaceae bacterium]
MRVRSLVLRLGLMVSTIAVLPFAHADEGKLRLRVVDAQTQRPLGDGQVTLVPRQGESRELRIADDGSVQTGGLAAGLYEVLVSRTGYQTARLPSVRVVDDKTTSLRVVLQVQRQNVEEVLVLGTAIGESLLTSVGTSQVDREALRSSAGSGGDVLRALDGLPGVFSDGEFSSFNVRGAGPRDNLILVDGIPFDKVVHFSESFGEADEVDGGGRYSVFAPNLIGSAEFQPGGWSSAYGGKAGSLLKLEVAEGNPDSAAYSARLDLAGVEVGYDGPSRFHDDTSLLLSARTYNFGWLFEAIGEEDIGTPKLTDVILKTSTQVSPQDKVQFLAIYAPEEYTRDMENVIATDEEEPGVYPDVELVRSKTDNALLGVTWSRLIGSDAELVNQIYYRNFDARSRIGEAYPEEFPIGTPADQIRARENLLNIRAAEQETGWQLDLFSDNALGRLSTGLRVTHLDLRYQLDLTEDWKIYTYDSDDFRPDPEQRYIVLTPESLNSHYEQAEVNYALYADQEFSAGDWSFRAGARYDRDNFSEENLLSPRAGATWLATDDLRITATLGRYYQAPRIEDRAADAANNGLENEVVDQFGIGFAYSINNKLDLFVEPYYQDLSNLVVEGDRVNQTFSNSGDGTSYGVDTALTRQFDNGWSADFKYSYNRARTRDLPGEPYNPSEYNRPHAASIGGVWEINQRWKLSARWKWASGKPSDDYVIYENVQDDGEPLRYSRETIAKNTGRYSGFSSLNFRADYRRSIGRADVIAFIDVINILEAENPSTSEFNERTGKNEVEEGEAFPLLGLRFEW